MADVKTSTPLPRQKEVILKINERDDVEKLAKLIEENNLPVRKDEGYLYKLLKTTNFDYEWAIYRLKNYEEFMKKESDWRNLKKSDIKAVLESGIVTITKDFDNDKHRVIWIRAALWNPSTIKAETILRVSGFMLEMATFDWTAEELGTGFILIMDMNQLGMSHVYGISTAFAQKLVHYITQCLRIPVKQVHNVNEPWLCSLVFAIFNVFLDEHIQDYIAFHGTDLTNMQKTVGLLALPEELGGVSKVIDGSHWMNMLENSDLQNELQVSGYNISNE